MITKSLSYQIEEILPEWRGKFLCCNELRKKLKLIRGETRSHKRKPSLKSREEHEIDFIGFIEAKMGSFNSFLAEKEEEYIIRLKELKDKLVKEEESNEGLIMVQKESVDLHGEMVLLENYSALNYIGFVKIIMKYEKRTGAPIQIPIVQSVMQQPFYTTEGIHNLVKQCELMVDHLFPTYKANVPSDGGPVVGDNHTLTLLGSKELQEMEHMEGLYLNRTVTALRILQEICGTSSTKTPFTLPPLQSINLEEILKAPVLEQEAE